MRRDAGKECWTPMEIRGVRGYFNLSGFNSPQLAA